MPQCSQLAKLAAGHSLAGTLAMNSVGVLLGRGGSKFVGILNGLQGAMFFQVAKTIYLRGWLELHFDAGFNQL